MKNKFAALALALTAAVLSGCMTMVKTFPDRSDPMMGAALFYLDTKEENTSGMLLRDMTFFVYRPGDESSSTQLLVGGHGWGGPIKGFSEHVFLIGLKPGKYSSIQPRMGIVGNEVHYARLDTPGGRFRDFDIEPGKVTVLGALDMNIKLALESQDSNSKTFTWKGSTLTFDDRPAARKHAVQEALKRQEAAKWAEPLQAALKDADSAEAAR